MQTNGEARTEFQEVKSVCRPASTDLTKGLFAVTEEDPKLCPSHHASLPAVLLIEAFSPPSSLPSKKPHKYVV